MIKEDSFMGTEYLKQNINAYQKGYVFLANAET